jgi:GT2 family glycosyltransferase
MNNPKILVGCPTSDLYSYCLKDYINAINSLNYNNYDVLLVDNSETEDNLHLLEKLNMPAIRIKYDKDVKIRLVNSRNKLREIALKKDYDYLLMTDQDTIIPKNIIENLVRHNKEIVSAVCFNWIDFNQRRMFTPALLISKDFKTRTGRYMDEGEIEEYVHKNPQLMRVKGCGLACVLIHKSILKKIKFRWESVTDDMDFCIDALKNNFKIFADTSVICKHLVLKKPFTLKELEQESKQNP